MQILAVCVALVAFAAIEPYARAFLRDLTLAWRERRAEKARRSGELGALELFLRSKEGVEDPATPGTWGLKVGPSRVWVSVAREAGGSWRVGVSVEVDRALDLEIRRPRFFQKRLDSGRVRSVAASEGEQPDLRFDVRRAEDERGELRDRLFSHAGEALTDGLARLLYHLGADEVTARHGRLGVAIVARDLVTERVRDVLEALIGVAGAYSRRPEIGALVERYLWLDGSSPRCPYCHVDIAEGEKDLTSCARCRTVHHGACFAEHGGCTLLGCGGTEAAS
ncbi:MAG TPA: hypothetical protein VFF73_17955 [Planctomycetota bacterium]|nr:hypothetical protein [Planctomycetota bacterium]